LSEDEIYEGERQSLIVFLLEHPNERFRAFDLKKYRSVPKRRVRKLITGQAEVKILRRTEAIFNLAAAKKP
jgi:hypothetical protein